MVYELVIDVIAAVSCMGAIGMALWGYKKWDVARRERRAEFLFNLIQRKENNMRKLLVLASVITVASVASAGLFDALVRGLAETGGDAIEESAKNRRGKESNDIDSSYYQKKEEKKDQPMTIHFWLERAAKEHFTFKYTREKADADGAEFYSAEFRLPNGRSQRVMIFSSVSYSYDEMVKIYHETVKHVVRSIVYSGPRLSDEQISKVKEAHRKVINDVEDFDHFSCCHVTTASGKSIVYVERLLGYDNDICKYHDYLEKSITKKLQMEKIKKTAVYADEIEREFTGKDLAGGVYEDSMLPAGRRDFGAIDETNGNMGMGTASGETKTITLPGGATMEMIYVAPGSFMMGSPSSEDGRFYCETQHSVTLTKGFWLGKYEVTQAQWRSVIGNNPSSFKGDNLPVENVSWDDCQTFIQKVNAHLSCGARLPTEAEWEFACRAGTTTAYFWGNALNGDKANCNGNNPCGTTVKGPNRETTVPVGSYAANAWGFCDMHGNVVEWCNDWDGPYPTGSLTDPLGPASGGRRVLRGGSWDYIARGCRSADRRNSRPDSRSEDRGFRLCCSAGGERGEKQ